MNPSSDSALHLVGVLLAAGRGKRMGATKQLLPWPPQQIDSKKDASGTVVESAFDSIAAHCEKIIVVLGHEAEAIAAALGAREFTRVVCDPEAQMIESIKAGLHAALQDEAMQGVMLHPADHPEVGATTMDELIEHHRNNPDRAIMPEHEGKGGHPVLVPRSLIGGILDYEGEGGLRAHWAANPGLQRRFPVNDPVCIRDLDTSEAYQAGH